MVPVDVVVVPDDWLDVVGENDHVKRGEKETEGKVLIG